MKLLKILTAIAPFLLLQLSHGETFCESRVVSTWEQQQIFTQYVNEFYHEKNMSAAFQHVRPDYIQHNPFVGQGAAIALKLLSEIWPSLDIKVYHVAFDSNVGYIHYRAQGPFYPVETAIVDIVRFDGSCVLEHWDVIQSLPRNATNPLALF